MKRIEVYAVGILLALVPAVFGLWGNASFSRNVPVRVPDQARASTAVAGVDTRQVEAAHLAGKTPAEHHHARHGADDPATHDVGDDHRGDRSGHRSDEGSGHNSDDRSGRSGSGEPEPGDDRGGADDPATHDVGDDHGGATGNTGGTSNTGGGSGVSGGGADDNTGHQSGGESGSGSGSGSGGSDDKESGGHGSDD